ncbi:MAG TPA: MtrB/PioB family decaheme-associated outer membrane protein [Vicinamibacterales bacterium]|jgi:MtrB/PioB family decaheme-associated outer membrane protein|nr:MtrB/PioB family decaheme-associated outer membrane protein [Vicinamibacterales bacterium]
MRTRTITLIGALLLVSAGLAQAQNQQQPTNGATQTTATPASSFTPTLGTVDFGYRSDSTRGDYPRYTRFRDLRDGAFLDRFRFGKETDTSLFRAEANNVGYRDQRYFGQFRSIGKLNVSFEWNQIPLFYSDVTSSLYRDAGNGRLVIDDPIQQAIQRAGTAAPVRDPVIAGALSTAQQYEMRSRRDLATFNMVYTLNRDTDVKFSVKNANRNGAQPYAFAFGTSPGANPVVEFAAPLDDRTTDVRGAIEFANAKGLLSVGYNGSWYDNKVPAIQFDNPLRITDQLGGSGAAIGQAVWWPANTAFSVNANGSYKLPRRTRANANISIGRWSQDETLYPATLNTALVTPVALPRTSANTEADIMSLVLGLSSRPVQNVWLNAKYRYYDYDNKTPHFGPVSRFMGDTNFVNQSGTTIPEQDENEPSSFKRQNLDLDASFTPVNYLAFGVGYGREDGDRTFRIYENTAEDIFRVTVDSTGNQYFTVRAKYEVSNRTGSGFDPHLLEEVGEQPETRHFDIANRDRTRATLLLSVFPASYLSLNASVGGGKDEYDETGFGLRDSDNTNWSAGFDVMPNEVVSFGVSYGYDKYTAFQYSRTANPLSATDKTFLDPRRDWAIDSDDIVKTLTTSLDLIKAFPKTDIRLGYDFSDGKATYVYGVKPEFPLAAPQQLTPVKNRLTGGYFDLQYFLRANVAVGVAYEYEEYKVDDFALDTDTLNRLDPRNPSGAYTSTIYSGYVFRPYTAHTAWLRMTYLW